jgi:hypothetical protein
MNRRSSREVAIDLFLYALPVYLSFSQALVLAGLSRAIVFLILAVLLMFLVACRPDIERAFAACLRALPSAWLAPVPRLRFRELSFAALSVPSAPSLSEPFQRPPPIFS